MDVLHRCDNPPCCNAYECLFLGTAVDNGQDMSIKGRHGCRNGTEHLAHGEEHWAAKLTADDVFQIREIAASMTVSALSRRFGVTRTAIRNARDGKTWSSV